MNKLVNVCRLCSGKIKIDSYYSRARKVSEYAEEIRKIFVYDTSIDISGIHPLYLCSICRRKLDRCKSSTDEYSTSNMPTFSEHSGSDCVICFGYSRKNVCPFKLHVKTKGEVRENANFDSKVKLIASQLGFRVEEKHENILTLHKAIFQNENFALDMHMKIDSSYTWHLFIANRVLPNASYFHMSLPAQLTSLNIEQVLHKISEANICCGNEDFPDLIRLKLEKGSDINFFDKEGNTKASLENNFFVQASSCTVIRVIDCELLVDACKIRCEACSHYRRSILWPQQYRLQRSITECPNKSIANIHLSRPEIERRLSDIQREHKLLLRGNVNLEKRIHKLVKRESVVVGPEWSKLLNEVTIKENCSFDSDSPQYLLWEEQKRYAALKNKKNMQWHPVMIRWCLSIYLKSPGIYILYIIYICIILGGLC